MQRIVPLAGSALVATLLFAGCDGGSGPPADAGSDAARPDGGGADDAGADGGVADDAGASEVPWVDEALRDCTRRGGAGATAPGEGLARVDVDPTVFPDARCVDGTGAVFYVRRATGPANANRWVIQLQGGGGCSTGDACASRWCSDETTNFGADKMSSRFAPERGTTGTGILANRPENPFEGWNHVFIHYCSSDMWTGRQPEVELEGAHPITGAPTRYRAMFQGKSIFDAVVDSLRRDGVDAVRYTAAGGSRVELPDLDEAEEVVLAGASAGGNGVIFNLDRLGTRLREANTACTGATCPLRVWGVIDSIYGVNLDRLDFTASVLCSGIGACTSEEYFMLDYANKLAVWASELDDSCEDWHAAMSTGEGHRCADGNFVIENHLTTPFVLRMGLTDSLIGTNMVERGFTVPERGDATLDLRLFAQLVAEQLRALPSITTTAHERDAITRAPGVFGPRCPKHETISHGPSTYDVRIDVAGTAVSFPQLITSWLAEGPSVAVDGLVGPAPACP